MIIYLNQQWLFRSRYNCNFCISRWISFTYAHKITIAKSIGSQFVLLYSLQSFSFSFTSQLFIDKQTSKQYTVCIRKVNNQYLICTRSCFGFDPIKKMIYVTSFWMNKKEYPNESKSQLVYYVSICTDEQKSI